jgi:uncharacterized protein (TIGR02117 family)
LKTLKKLLRLLAYSLLILIIAIALFFLCDAVLGRIPTKAEANTHKDVLIYLQSDGTHCDLALPVKTSVIDWSREIRYEHTRSRDSNMTYLSFGWGEKIFYLETPQWSDLTVKNALRSSLGFGSPAVHTRFHFSLQAHENCIPIYLSWEQYRRLVAYLQKSLERNKQGQLIHIPTPTSYGPSDAFYEGHGHYGFNHSCNTWVNRALKSCGQKAALWTAFEKGVMRWHR